MTPARALGSPFAQGRGRRHQFAARAVFVEQGRRDQLRAKSSERINSTSSPDTGSPAHHGANDCAYGVHVDEDIGRLSSPGRRSLRSPSGAHPSNHSSRIGPDVRSSAKGGTAVSFARAVAPDDKQARRQRLCARPLSRGLHAHTCGTESRGLKPCLPRKSTASTNGALAAIRSFGSAKP